MSDFGEIVADRIYTPRVLGLRLGVNERTVQRWVTCHGLPACRRFRLTLISGQDFVAWVSSMSGGDDDFCSSSPGSPVGPSDLGDEVEGSGDGSMEAEEHRDSRQKRSRKGRDSS